ncbi:MAG: glycosyl transferase family 2 [uncultured bacterium]|nr:MAG: glycosyl transferase family 2 [uncultured bacterium]
MKYFFKSVEKKVVIVLPAFNAAETLEATIGEIPPDSYDEIILVDDASRDKTVELAQHLVTHVICHKTNTGYGGNQKTCYSEALKRGADIIVMLHPDNQYNPKLIPNMVLPIYLGQADVVLASRFIQDPLKGGPLAGGMPALKYYVNQIITAIQNRMMGTYFSEFHTGYRAFSREALEQVDFRKLSDDFLFDNQIIAQLVHRKLKFQQIGVETRYFDEASSIRLIPGIRYAMGCMYVGFRFMLHRKGLLRWDLLK